MPFSVEPRPDPTTGATLFRVIDATTGNPAKHIKTGTELDGGGQTDNQAAGRIADKLNKWEQSTAEKEQKNG